MRKVQKVERVPKQKERIENNTVVIGMIGTNVILECNVGKNNVTVIPKICEVEWIFLLFKYAKNNLLGVNFSFSNLILTSYSS